MKDSSPTRHPTHAPGRSAIVLGLYTGALLVLLMFCALVAANRLPGLEHYALERNAVCKMMFDAPRKLRASLVANGYLENEEER